MEKKYQIICYKVLSDILNILSSQGRNPYLFDSIKEAEKEIETLLLADERAFDWTFEILTVYNKKQKEVLGDK